MSNNFKMVRDRVLVTMVDQ